MNLKLIIVSVCLLATTLVLQLFSMLTIEIGKVPSVLGQIRIFCYDQSGLAYFFCGLGYILSAGHRGKVLLAEAAREFLRYSCRHKPFLPQFLQPINNYYQIFLN